VITFRSEDKVRHRLFGRDNDAKISPRQKASRLGESAKQFLNQFLMNFRGEFFPETIADIHGRYGAGLAEVTVQKLHEVLESRRPKLETTVADLKQRATKIREILSPVEDLSATSEQVASAIESLSDQFAAADADQILQPMPRRTRKQGRGPVRGSKRGSRT